MSFLSSNTLSKTTLISAAIATVLLMVGCDKTETATDQATDTTSVETTANTKEVNTSSSPVSSVTSNSGSAVMASIVLDTINNALFGTLINDGNLSAEQQTCLQARDKELGKSKIEAYYQSQFSEAELQQLADFYTSDTGKIMLAYANEQLLIMSGEEVANPMATPPADEIAKFQEFMQSPLGMKNQAINEDEGKGSMMDDLDPIIDAEFKRCNIDIKMADIT